MLVLVTMLCTFVRLDGNPLVGCVLPLLDETDETDVTDETEDRRGGSTVVLGVRMDDDGGEPPENEGC